MKRQIKIILIWSVLGFMILLGATAYHEEAHSAIYRNVGHCEGLEVVLNNSCGIGIVPHNCSMTQEEYMLFLELNAQNEITFYQSVWIIIAIMAAGLSTTLAAGDPPGCRNRSC